MDIPARQTPGWPVGVEGIRAAGPDAVLVDLGLRRPDRFAHSSYVLVGGAARPNVRVAAELLARGHESVPGPSG